jgi:hypothetical protein
VALRQRQRRRVGVRPHVIASLTGRVPSGLRSSRRSILA